jgi:hypothetical protein
LYPHLKTTPLAGERLSSHLRALLLCFGTYLPPPTTLSGAVTIPAAARSTRVPEEILTESVLETIKTRCLLVGNPISTRAISPDTSSPILDVPPEAPPRSESDFSRLSADASDSAFSVVSHTNLGGASDLRQVNGRLEALASLYTRHSTATDLRIRVVPPLSQQTGTGRGTLIIPGWIRERAAEVLFEGGDVDESSVAEIVLDSLLKVTNLQLLNCTPKRHTNTFIRYLSTFVKRLSVQSCLWVVLQHFLVSLRGYKLNLSTPYPHRPQHHLLHYVVSGWCLPMIAMLHFAHFSHSLQSSITRILLLQA